jgi:hypothetical protein
LRYRSRSCGRKYSDRRAGNVSADLQGSAM